MLHLQIKTTLQIKPIFMNGPWLTFNDNISYNMVATFLKKQKTKNTETNKNFDYYSPCLYALDA